MVPHNKVPKQYLLPATQVTWLHSYFWYTIIQLTMFVSTTSVQNTSKSKFRCHTMTLRDLTMRLSHFKFIYFCLLQSTFFHPGDCVNGTLLSRRLRTAALQLIYVYLHCWQALSLYFVLIKGWNMTALATDFHLINFSEALLGGSQVSGSEWRRRCRCLMMNKWSYFSHRTLITSQ